jgi:predicted nucleic acid-binding protein
VAATPDRGRRTRATRGGGAGRGRRRELDCGDDDIPRIRGLASRYEDLPLGFADASVVACAERNGGRVVTLDDRDFAVVAREEAIVVLPGAR